jgi:hypothetical protein
MPGLKSVESATTAAAVPALLTFLGHKLSFLSTQLLVRTYHQVFPQVISATSTVSTSFPSLPPMVTLVMDSQTFGYLSHSPFPLSRPLNLLLESSKQQCWARNLRSCNLPLSFGKKAPFDPLCALAGFPRHGALVAKFSLAPAGDMVASMNQLDHRMTFWASLPTVLLYKRANDSRIVFWLAEQALRVGNLATMHARHRPAGGARSTTTECPSGA